MSVLVDFDDVVGFFFTFPLFINRFISGGKLVGEILIIYL